MFSSKAALSLIRSGICHSFLSKSSRSTTSSCVSSSKQKYPPRLKPHRLAAGERKAATSFDTIVPPWLAVLTRNTPGQSISQVCTLPHGDFSGP